MIRPGPDLIEPGRSPGGLVLRVYDFAENVIVEQLLTPTADLGALADLAADEVKRAPGPVAVVVYDGDTGRRWTPDVYRECGYEPGGRL
jgi:hypothetical protein